MHILEYILISTIIVLQFISYIRTRKEINKMEEVFPEQDGIELKDIKFQRSLLSELDELAINKRLYGITEVDGVVDFTEYIEEQIFSGQALSDEETLIDIIPIKSRKRKEKKLQTKLIKTRTKCSDTFRTITSETNSYLLQNSENAIDFNIIKDIAERKLEAQYNQVESSLHTPLYLGLLGTIFGIVIGLLFLAFDAPEEELTDTLANQIPNLLKGVSIAMAASFIGLLLTIISTSYDYRKGLQKTDEKKNKYLTFIQSKLLSSVRDFSSNFKELSTNLSEINKEFSVDMSKSIELFTSSINRLENDIIQNQTHLIESIHKIDFVNLEKTFRNIDSSASNLSGNLQTQAGYIQNLYNSIQLLKTQEEATKAASASIIDKMRKSYEDLNKLSTKEMEQIKQKYAELNPEFKQLNKLSELEKIKSSLEVNNNEQIKTNKKLISHIDNTGNTSQAILKELKSLNSNLKNISSNSSTSNNTKKKNIWNRFKALFIKERTKGSTLAGKNNKSKSKNENKKNSTSNQNQNQNQKLRNVKKIKQ